MIHLIPSAERHHQDFGWLDTRWHFSFGDYYDPANVNWGALRVFNDDVIRGGKGFGAHPHRDMEIVTYVLAGALEHKDSLGNRGVIHPGEVQVMSAGRGIEHAEYNHSKSEPVRLIQLWIMPRKRGNTPRWEQKQFSPEQRRNTLLPVVSDGRIPGSLAIDQDAAIYVAALDAGREVRHELTTDRKAYLFVIAGEVTVNGKPLSAGDQARVERESLLTLRAGADAEVMLLDLPEMK